jgi:hypothetical protein
MKRTLAATSWIVACAFLVSAAAQTPQPPTEQQRPPDQEQPRPDPQQPRPDPQQQPRTPAERPQVKAADETVTLTGCLAAGDQPNTFKLTDIRAADKMAAQPGEMVGTTGIKTGEAIQLTGTDEAKLKGHVGHTIEVTGMLVPRKEGDPGAPATPEAARPDAPAAKEKADMRLNVKSFKHVDATCPPAGN